MSSPRPQSSGDAAGPKRRRGHGRGRGGQAAAIAPPATPSSPSAPNDGSAARFQERPQGQQANTKPRQRPSQTTESPTAVSARQRNPNRITPQSAKSDQSSVTFSGKEHSRPPSAVTSSAPGVSAASASDIAPRRRTQRGGRANRERHAHRAEAAAAANPVSADAASSKGIAQPSPKPPRQGSQGQRRQQPQQRPQQPQHPQQQRPQQQQQQRPQRPQQQRSDRQQQRAQQPQQQRSQQQHSDQKQQLQRTGSQQLSDSATSDPPLSKSQLRRRQRNAARQRKLATEQQSVATAAVESPKNARAASAHHSASPRGRRVSGQQGRNAQGTTKAAQPRVISFLDSFEIEEQNLVLETPQAPEHLAPHIAEAVMLAKLLSPTPSRRTAKPALKQPKKPNDASSQSKKAANAVQSKKAANAVPSKTTNPVSSQTADTKVKPAEKPVKKEAAEPVTLPQIKAQPETTQPDNTNSSQPVAEKSLHKAATTSSDSKAAAVSSRAPKPKQGGKKTRKKKQKQKKRSPVNDETAQLLAEWEQFEADLKAKKEQEAAAKSKAKRTKRASKANATTTSTTPAPDSRASTQQVAHAAQTSAAPKPAKTAQSATPPASLETTPAAEESQPRTRSWRNRVGSSYTRADMVSERMREAQGFLAQRDEEAAQQAKDAALKVTVAKPTSPMRSSLRRNANTGQRKSVRFLFAEPDGTDKVVAPEPVVIEEVEEQEKKAAPRKRNWANRSSQPYSRMGFLSERMQRIAEEKMAAQQETEKASEPEKAAEPQSAADAQATDGAPRRRSWRDRVVRYVPRTAPPPPSEDSAEETDAAADLPAASLSSTPDLRAKYAELSVLKLKVELRKRGVDSAELSDMTRQQMIDRLCAADVAASQPTTANAPSASAEPLPLPSGVTQEPKANQAAQVPAKESPPKQADNRATAQPVPEAQAKEATPAPSATEPPRAFNSISKLVYYMTVKQPRLQAPPAPVEPAKPSEISAAVAEQAVGRSAAVSTPAVSAKKEAEPAPEAPRAHDPKDAPVAVAAPSPKPVLPFEAVPKLVYYMTLKQPRLPQPTAAPTPAPVNYLEQLPAASLLAPLTRSRGKRRARRPTQWPLPYDISVSEPTFVAPKVQSAGPTLPRGAMALPGMGMGMGGFNPAAVKLRSTGKGANGGNPLAASSPPAIAGAVNPFGGMQPGVNPLAALRARKAAKQQQEGSNETNTAPVDASAQEDSTAVVRDPLAALRARKAAGAVASSANPLAQSEPTSQQQQPKRDPLAALRARKASMKSTPDRSAQEQNNAEAQPKRDPLAALRARKAAAAAQQTAPGDNR